MKLRSLASLTLPLLALLAGTASAEPFRLIVTDMEPPLVPNSVVDIALAEGYFARAGVEVEIIRVQQTPMAMAALQSGEGEMANVATEGLVQLAAQEGGRTLRAVTSPNKALPYLIAGKKDLTIEGLKGQPFGIGRIGSLDHTLLGKVLASKGLSEADVELVALGQPNARAQALLAGQIAATTMSVGSLLALPNPQDLSVLVTVDDYYAAAPVVSKVNAVTQDTLEKRGSEVEAVIEALTLAARDMAAEKSAWAKAMAKLRPDVAPETLEALSEAYQNSWSVNGGVQAQELAETAAWLYEGEDFKGLAKVELSAWVDFTPADHVLAKIGTSDKGDKVSR